MSVSTVDYLHAIKFGSSATITQLEDAGDSLGLSEVIARSAGETNPLFRTIGGARPSFSFTTPQLGTLLGIMGQYGLGAAANLDFEVKRATMLGRREAAATTTHRRYRAAQYLAYWTEIRASHQGNATAAVTVMPIWDGTNPPVVPAGDVALGGVAAFTELYTLGPTFVNGTQIFGGQDAVVRSGIALDQVGGDGEIWDSFGCVQETDPVIEITALDIPGIDSYGREGTALTSLSQYFTRKAGVTGNVANGTANHIKITATAGAIYPMDLRGSGSSRVSRGLRIALTAPTASGNPMTITTASAITS